MKNATCLCVGMLLLNVQIDGATNATDGQTPTSTTNQALRAQEETLPQEIAKGWSPTIPSFDKYSNIQSTPATKPNGEPTASNPGEISPSGVPNFLDNDPKNVLPPYPENTHYLEEIPHKQDTASPLSTTTFPDQGLPSSPPFPAKTNDREEMHFDYLKQGLSPSSFINPSILYSPSSSIADIKEKQESVPTSFNSKATLIPDPEVKPDALSKNAKQIPLPPSPVTKPNEKPYSLENTKLN